MRERLVGVLVALTVLIIALLAVPRAYFLAQMVETDETESLQRTASVMALALNEHVEAGHPVTQEYLATLVTNTEGIRYAGATGTVAAGLDVSGTDVLRATRTLDADATLTLVRSRAYVDRQISQAIVPLAVAGLLLLALSLLLAFSLARRLSRPFQELAAAAERLGSGRFSEVRIDHYSIPEAENIGAALRLSSERLAVLLKRERDFAANASHQLRTPIAALRLQLEDLTYWPETPPEVARELEASMGELDRLNGAITQYLDLARGKRRVLDAEVDLVDLVRASVLRREPSAEAAGRSISWVGPTPVPVLVQAGTVDQILDVLLDNAFQHGAGHVTVSALLRDGTPIIRVTDEGRRRLSPEIFQRGHSAAGGTGLGLAVATELSHSIGARLDLCRAATTCFELQLPASALVDPDVPAELGHVHSPAVVDARP